MRSLLLSTILCVNTPLLSCLLSTLQVGYHILDIPLPYSSSCSKNKWCKSSLLNLCHTFAIHMFLLILMLSVDLLGSEIFIRFCVWVTNPAGHQKRQIFVFPKSPLHEHPTARQQMYLLPDLGSLH